MRFSHSATHLIMLLTLLTSVGCVRLRSLTLDTSALVSATPNPEPGCNTAFTFSADGSALRPYQIWSTTDASTLTTNNTTGTYVVLCADLDYANATIAPFPTFSGNFSGNSHQIQNLTIIGTGAGAGFFSALSGATVTDTIFSSITVAGTSEHAGVLAGTMASGSVSGVVVSNSSVSASSGFPGGLIGVITGSTVGNNAVVTRNRITSTLVTALTGNAMGGLIGAIHSENSVNDQVTFNVVSASIDTQGGSYCTGGAIGYTSNGVISQNAVTVTYLSPGSYQRTSGLLGCVQVGAGGSLSITNNSAIFTGLDGGGFGRVGGLLGDHDTNTNVTIDTNWIEGTVTASHPSTKGMVFGRASNTISIFNTYWLDDSSGLPAYQSCGGPCSLDGNSSAVLPAALNGTPFNGGDWSNTSIWSFTPGQRPTLVGLP